MRLWSIHPKYLDTKGIVALWREALLAKAVLTNKTKGYKNHPQLLRFKEQKSPLNSINNYLKEIWQESKKRDFKFDEKKIGRFKPCEKIKVSDGQVQFEFEHLLKKLKKRDETKFQEFKNLNNIETNSLFITVPGGIESWEKI